MEPIITADKTYPQRAVTPYAPIMVGARPKVELEAKGYCHIQQPVSKDYFMEVMAQWGAIRSETELFVSPEMAARQQRQRNPKSNSARPSVYQSHAIPLHTDRPDERIIGWYCCEQDKEDGAIRMLDMQSVLNRLAPDILTGLRAVKLHFIRKAKGQETLVEEPLLRLCGDTFEVYYASWFLLNEYPAAQQAALEALQESIRQWEAEALVTVRLQPGEALIINNKRMLHGRGAIGLNRKRQLLRVGVQQVA